MANWTINFRFTSSGQKSGASSAQQLKANGNAFARIIVRDMAISASSRMYDTARKTLTKSLRAVVTSEINRMARLIAAGFAVQDGYKGPYGNISLASGFDGVSDESRSLGWEQRFERSSMKIAWAKRNPKYLRQKSREGTSGYWMRRHGDLQQYLGSLQADDYLESFGNLVVRFVRTGISTFDAISNVTSASTQGRNSAKVNVGRLEVRYFGDITPAMMPGLNNMTPNYGMDGSNPGVASLLPENDDTYKLMQRSWHKSGRKFRPAVDPFVGYFLTRAIPNAVWRRTERLVSAPLNNLNSGVRESLGNQYDIGAGWRG